jgi:hypothetical protein
VTALAEPGRRQGDCSEAAKPEPALAHAATEPETSVQKKLWERFFAPTPGAHIRFILIILGILMLEMVIQGYLGSIGLIKPVNSWF